MQTHGMCSIAQQQMLGDCIARGKRRHGCAEKRPVCTRPCGGDPKIRGGAFAREQMKSARIHRQQDPRRIWAVERKRLQFWKERRKIDRIVDYRWRGD